MSEQVLDVCIVGAGVAGALLAERLQRAGKNVVILEQDWARRAGHEGHAAIDPAGRGYVDAPGTAYEYNHRTGPGGSSRGWAAYTPRPLPGDLSGELPWPMNYAELEPWLCRAEAALGVAGADDNPYAAPRSQPFPMPAHAFSYFDENFFLPACERLGWRGHSRPVAVNSRPYGGRPACQACRVCPRCPSGARYRADGAQLATFVRNGGVLREGVRARRLEVDRDGRIVALHARDLGANRDLAFRAGQFVLAAGGVETPRLLALSATTASPLGLGNGGGHLGARFSDHMVLYFGVRMPRPVGGALGFATAACDHFRARPPAGTGTFSIWLAPESDAPWLAARATAGDELRIDALWRDVGCTAVGLLTVEMRGVANMVLGHSTDALGDRVLQVALEPSPRDRRTCDAAAAEALRLADVLGALDVNLPWTEGGHFLWGSHPLCACPMARSEAEGVCDSQLRVFGTQNLYLATSGVFPTFGAANPTLTIAALALRLATALGG